VIEDISGVFTGHHPEADETDTGGGRSLHLVEASPRCCARSAGASRKG